MAAGGGGGGGSRGGGGPRVGGRPGGGAAAAPPAPEKLPVHVEDALSYLDQVKIRFGSDPATYNGFLEIMKEFKSQSIDTPGVIRRVSHLFHEHPDLIIGFNTFLPLGYRIEIPRNGRPGLPGPLLGQVPPEPAGSPPSGGGPEGPPGRPPEDPPAGPPPPGAPPLEADSVEFNNAISYVNKIKTRFLDRPEIYRSFLEILHTYQKEQLNTKGCPFRGMSEEEVFTEVANLFRGQEDLLAEFGQFLPEAKRSLFTGNGPCDPQGLPQADGERPPEPGKKRPRPLLLRPLPGPAKKKMKLRGAKDPSVAAAGKYGTLQELSFFDKVRRALKSQEVYENFLRCIALFNQELVSGAELLQLVTPFLGKFPELFAQFKSFFGVKELSFGGPPERPLGEGGGGGGVCREIDYASCKRIGSSYRALPKTYQQPKCSGRTAICKEVLNDTWVSFPSWSEDSTFVSSKKTAYEEQLHRCEDERFELDVVLETNLATIRVLESVQKKLSRLGAEEAERFRLDDRLGGTSEVIQRRAVHRIYGDKAPEVLESLKRSPLAALPVVLKRLKAKEEEWREAQQGFNKVWREQYEKAYLKSLDHQAAHFKQHDAKALRSKSLLNEIESAYDEHQEQHPDGRGPPAPHLVLPYEDPPLLEDAAGLIAFAARRQPSIPREDQASIVHLLQRFLPGLFAARPPPAPHTPPPGPPRAPTPSKPPNPETRDLRKRPVLNEDRTPKPDPEAHVPPPGGPGGPPPPPPGEPYTLFFANNHWYFFLRLHQTLCARLRSLRRQAQAQLLERRREQARERAFLAGGGGGGGRGGGGGGGGGRAGDPATELRLRQPSEVELEEYYPAFLDLARNLLDGNIDPAQYEDTLREMFTIHAYIGFTLDKLVQNIVRQLHHLVSDEVCLKVVELYLAERQQQAAAGGHLTPQAVRVARETSYQWKAERCMADENCFKVVFLQRPDQVIMTIELLDTEETQTEDPTEVQHLANYMEQYVGADGPPGGLAEGAPLKPVFLQRNLLRFQRWQRRQVLGARPRGAGGWRALVGVQSASNLDCRFRPGSHRMLFVLNAEDYMYRRGALSRARQAQPRVLLRHHRRFEAWHQRWLSRHMGREAGAAARDWLLGPEGAEPRTSLESRRVHGVLVNRYRVHCAARDASP